MTKSPEGYQPSAEEMAKAEETMTPTQKELSSNRPDLRAEKSLGEYDRIKTEMGVSGDLEFHQGQQTRDGYDQTVHGTINGHEIVVSSDGTGFVDGVSIASNFGLNTELAKKLYRKYEKLARAGTKARGDKRTSEYLVEKAQKEVEGKPDNKQESDKERRQKWVAAIKVAEELLEKSED